MKMRIEEEQSEEALRVRVAPFVTHERYEPCLWDCLFSFFGLSSCTMLPLYLLIPLPAIILPLLLTDQLLATLLPAAIALLLALAYRLYAQCTNNSQCIDWLQLLLAPLVAYFLASHFSFLSSLNAFKPLLIASSVATAYLVLPLTATPPVKEFSAPPLYAELGINSSRTVRPILLLLILLAQFILKTTGQKYAAFVLAVMGSLVWVLCLTGFIGSFASTAQGLCGLGNYLLFGSSAKVDSLRSLILFLCNVAVTLLSTAFASYQDYLALLLVFSFVSGLGLQFLLLQAATFKGFSPLKLMLMFSTLAGSLLLLYITLPASPSLLIGAVISFGLCCLLHILSQLQAPMFLFVFKGFNLSVPKLMTQLVQGLTRAAFWLSAVVILKRTNFVTDTGDTYLQNLLILRALNRAISRESEPLLHILMLISGITGSFYFLYWAPFYPAYIHLLAPFIAPKKTPVSAPLQVFCLVVNCVMTPWIWLGLPTRTVFGLPIYLPYYGFGQCSQPRAFGRQGQLFKKVIKDLRVQRPFELFRLSKWLIVARQVERLVCGRVIQFRVLQAQEMTSCHNEEAQTVDDLVTYIQSGKGEQSCLPGADTVLTPLRSFKMQLHDENELKLTGIIETQQFCDCLRANFLSLLIYFYFKRGLNESDKVRLLRVQDEFADLATVSKMREMLPDKLIAELGLEHQLRDIATLNKSGSARSVYMNNKSSEPRAIIGLLDDQDDLVSHFTKRKPASPVAPAVLIPQTVVQVSAEESRSEQVCHFRVLAVIYKLTLGSVKGTQQASIYKYFSEENQACKSKALEGWKQVGTLVRDAVRISFVLTTNRFVEGQLGPPSLADILQHQSSNLAGMPGEAEFGQGLEGRAAEVWSLVFSEKEQRLGVVRYNLSELSGMSFCLHKSLAEAVWANQAFQMFFVHNDDDERYSVQSHRRLLRNILTQAGPLPLGYAPLYSGPLLVA